MFSTAITTNANLMNYKYFLIYYRKSLSELADNVIQQYKIKLKTIVKSSFNLSVVKLLNRLNQEISYWVKNYCSLSSFELNSGLDLYLYKLLWKFVKRLHPRRARTWIYAKYWGIFSGVCRFFCYEKSKNNFYFLQSHNNSNVFVECLPLLLDVQYFFNYKKLYLVLFKKSRNYWKGVFKKLLISQRGICYICYKPLDFSNSKILFYNKYSGKNFKSSSIPNVLIIHNYCFN